MTDFNFREDIGELAYVTACVGYSRLGIHEQSGLQTSKLYDRLWNTLTASEQMRCSAFMFQMQELDRRASGES